MKHIVLIPFTGIGLQGGFRGNAWYAARILIFKNYTLKSLKNQTNKDFIIWCTFRPQEHFNLNPLTFEIMEALDVEGIGYVCTFNGPPFHDDKFGGSFTTKLKNAARILRSSYRNRTIKDIIPNLREIFVDKNSTLEGRLQSSLNTLAPLFDAEEQVLLTRIDSDDMFRGDAIETIKTCLGTTICMSKGYIYDTEQNRLAEYNPKTNPPFYSLSFINKQVFLNANLHLNWSGNFKSHEEIGNRAFKTVISNRMYCVTTRNPKLHISTQFSHPYTGKEIIGTIEKQTILKSFGI